MIFPAVLLGALAQELAKSRGASHGVQLLVGAVVTAAAVLLLCLRRFAAVRRSVAQPAVAARANAVSSADPNREHDPERFLSTLPNWNAQAFRDIVARGAGALAALELVRKVESGSVGQQLKDAVGESVQRRWPVVVSTLSAWPDGAAQRGGWYLVWAYAPGADARAFGSALASALGPIAEPSLEQRVVSVAVRGAGAESADAAIRAAEDELHRWQHNEVGPEFRWSDASAR